MGLCRLLLSCFQLHGEIEVCSLCFTLTDKERQRPTLGVRYSEG